VTHTTLSLTPGGATCSCGREFSVWSTKRRSSWSVAHDFQRTLNMVRANAQRHADARRPV
jgi:hypothetical protein